VVCIYYDGRDGHKREWNQTIATDFVDEVVKQGGKALGTIFLFLSVTLLPTPTLPFITPFSFTDMFRLCKDGKVSLFLCLYSDDMYTHTFTHTFTNSHTQDDWPHEDWWWDITDAFGGGK
jgi:hypothetical protein